MFRQTLQQSYWFKDRAYISCGKQGYFARDCKGGQSNHTIKGTRLADGAYVQRDNGALRGIKECLINSFAFYYNNICQIYKDAKYSVSYWPQELLLPKFRGTNKPAYRADIKDDKFNIGEVFTNNKAIRAAYQELVDLGEVKTKAETATIIEQGLVTGIITPLDTISITL